jgi:DNA-binding MarR family transcriptional regulator
MTIRKRGKNAADEHGSVDYKFLADFRYELRRFQAFSHQAAKDAGLTGQQHQALLAIRGGGLITVGDLAKKLLVAHNTAAELTDRMIGRDLLRRQPDSDDRRRVLLQLTQNGERRLKALSKVHLQAIQTVAPALLRFCRSLKKLEQTNIRPKRGVTPSAFRQPA